MSGSAVAHSRPMPVRLLGWQPLRRDRLAGFATVQIGALIIHDAPVFAGDGRYWANVPAKPQLDADGRQRRDSGGKVQYAPVLQWATREARASFSDAVVQAVLAAHPDDLEEAAP